MRVAKAFQNEPPLLNERRYREPYGTASASLVHCAITQFTRLWKVPIIGSPENPLCGHAELSAKKTPMPEYAHNKFRTHELMAFLAWAPLIDETSVCPRQCNGRCFTNVNDSSSVLQVSAMRISNTFFSYDFCRAHAVEKLLLGKTHFIWNSHL